MGCVNHNIVATVYAFICIVYYEYNTWAFWYCLISSTDHRQINPAKAKFQG